MSRTPDDELERLKKEIAIERLVGTSGVQLKKTGERTDRPLSISQ